MTLLLRVSVFRSFPDTILIKVPKGEALTLPPLTAPFEKNALAHQLGMAGIHARVDDEHPGRWEPEIRRAEFAQRGERAHKTRMREAQAAVIMSGALDLAARERGALVKKLHEVNDEKEGLKKKIAAAKSKVFEGGAYMDPVAFRALEARLGEAKLEVQAIQARLGELRRAEKEENAQARREEADRFVECARRMLDEETFFAILAAANDGDDEEGDRR